MVKIASNCFYTPRYIRFPGVLSNTVSRKHITWNHDNLFNRGVINSGVSVFMIGMVDLTDASGNNVPVTS
ncbi:hypothetical protein [Thomasclavelia cocleata]|uniref:hypothetical protein n=1 Tax=Thomasclavelia cocleata TaxID=69824 RepID=UPI001B808626|nr:hypothetical protein [Thomasclavelia cocleata]